VGAKPTFLLGQAMEQIDRIREIADRIAVAEGLELVEVAFVGQGRNAVLRIFLDKPGGITVRDCERVSREMGVVLDVENLIPGSYTLEVSSPGLDRPLLKPSDYERFAGKRVKLVLKSPHDGRRRLRGLLRGMRDGRVELEEENGEAIGIEYAAIQKANLVFEWGNGTRRREPRTR